MGEAVIAGYLRAAQSRSKPNDPEKDRFHKIGVHDLLSMRLEQSTGGSWGPLRGYSMPRKGVLDVPLPTAAGDSA